MNPVTGPFSRSISTKDVSAYSRWYRQKRPYNKPLPYISWSRRTLSRSGRYPPTYDGPTGTFNPYWAYAFHKDHDTPLQKLVVQTSNEARSRLNDAIRSRIQLGADLAEYRSTIDMISKRAGQLRRFSTKLRRFDFLGAARELGTSIYPKGNRYFRQTKAGVHREVKLKKHASAFADNWLEFWFGWSPLVKEIGEAIELHDKPIKASFISAKYRLEGSSFDWQDQWWPWVTRDILSGRHQFSVVVKCGCSVYVSNPNLALASQLGLTNPASVAWEVVPFSFVVDWFYNVSQWLSSMDANLGLTLGDMWSTVLQKDFCYAQETNSARFFANDQWYEPGLFWACTSSMHDMSRSVGTLPEITLSQKRYSLPITRAATAISLLIQTGFNRK